jgi:hypothetical protein
MDQLGYLQMGPEENVDAYYSRLRSLLHKWHNHGIPPNYLKNQFIRGLLNPECIVMVNMANPYTLEEAYNIAKRWEESTMRAHYGYNYRPEVHPYSILGGDPQSVYNQPGMDSYERDYYPRRILNPQPLAIRTPLELKPQPLDIKAAPEDSNTKEIIELQQKFKELSVQLANAKDKRPKATNQRTNVWCANCGGHGHLPTECSSPINNKGKKCSYCGGKGHDITTCWNISEVRMVVIDTNNHPGPNRNVNKAPYSVTSKRPFTRPNVEPPYKPGDGRPRWNDTYNKHPVWNGPPTNPNTHNYGPLEKGKHIVCFNCGELGHYRNECPNPRKQVGYTPLCGRCHEPGYISTYCTAVITKFPPSERDYPKTKQVQITENVNHIAQMLDSEPVYVTKSQARKALVERSSDSDSPTEVIKKTKETPKKLILDIPVMDKLLNPIPVIPPNIPLNSIPSTSELPQKSQEPIEKSATEVPIVEINSKPPIQEVPLISKPPLITPTFYRTPRKV